MHPITFHPVILGLIACATGFHLTTAAGAPAADWPQWRGPNRDGVVPNAPKLAALPATLNIAWKIPAGPGHASVIVEGKHLFYVDELEGKEVAHLCDSATGKELWRQAYADPAEYSNYGTGPRCTPLFDGDRIYAQSGRGEFRCFNRADGKTLWRFNFEKDYGATFFGNKSSDPAAKETAARRHGNNGSPVVDGNRIFVPVGSPDGATLVAFDKLTGKELWRAGSDNTAYSSLMMATIEGVRQVVHLTGDALMGVAADSGRILWRTPVKTGAKRHVFTPIIEGNRILISSSTIGMIQFAVSKAGSQFDIKPAWENKDVKVTIGTSALVGGALYGIGTSKGQSASDYACVDAKSGKTLWTKPGFGDYASTTVFGDKLVVLNSNGEMYLLAADPTGYKELGRMQACGKTYSHPAYAQGRLYVRDDRQIMALVFP
jgi:outer membrane protein assembly factor BamB